MTFDLDLYLHGHSTLFWLGIQHDSIVWVISWVSSERRHSSCSSYYCSCDPELLNVKYCAFKKRITNRSTSYWVVKIKFSIKEVQMESLHLCCWKNPCWYQKTALLAHFGLRPFRMSLPGSVKDMEGFIMYTWVTMNIVAALVTVGAAPTASSFCT